MPIFVDQTIWLVPEKTNGVAFDFKTDPGNRIDTAQTKKKLSFVNQTTTITHGSGRPSEMHNPVLEFTQ